MHNKALILQPVTPKLEEASDSPSSRYRVTFFPNRAHHKALRASSFELRTSGIRMLSANPKASGRLPQPLPTELLSREQSPLGPHAAPAPVSGTPTRLASHAQKALFLRACARCPRGQGWAPREPPPTRRSGVASSPALLPHPCSFSPPVCIKGGCNRLCHLLPGSSKGEFKTHVWTNLNRCSTHY